MSQHSDTGTGVSGIDRETAERARRILESPNGVPPRTEDVEAAIAPLEKVLTATPPGPLRITILSNLGLLLMTRFQLAGPASEPDLRRAVGHLREAQHLHERETGHPALSATIANMISAQHALAELTRDQEHLDEAIREGRKAVLRLDPDIPQRASVLASLSSALRVRYDWTGNTGDLTEAVELGRRAAADLGHSSVRRGPVLSSLAGSLLAAGEPEESARVYAEALASFREASDADGEARALNNLAGAVARSGRTEEAVEHYRQAVEAFTGLGEDVGRGRGLNNLAHALTRLGRHEEAVEAHTAAWHCRSAAFGPAHPESLDSLRNLAAAHLTAGHRTEATDTYTRLHTLCHDTLGPGHPRTAEARRALDDLNEPR